MRLPADKSIAIRALLLSAIASEPWRITGLDGVGDDVRRAQRAAEQLASGARELTIECGGSQTLLRLVAGIAATRVGRVTLLPDASLARRPQAALARVLGPALQGLVVTGREEHGDVDVHIDPASAQLKGAALLAALGRHGTTRVSEAYPTRDHTEQLLRAAGVPVGEDRALVVRGPCVVGAHTIDVPGDPSSAALLAIAALRPGGVATFEHVVTSPLRTGFFAALARMGADVRVGATDIRVAYGALAAIEVAPHEVPSLVDEVPALVAVACLARGTTKLHGLATLRTKESDRVASAAALARAFGATVVEGPDSLAITAGRGVGRAVTVAAFDDHRIAMAALALGRALGLAVEVDEECVAKSFPGFRAALA